jgi:hypothetical protein
MSVPVKYPSAVLLAVQWLRTALPLATGHDVAVHAKVPNPRPAGPMVVVRRTGGLPDSAYRDRPRLDLQCWDEDEHAAEDLAGWAHAVMLQAKNQLVNGVRIGRTDTFLGPYVNPDPASSAPRYLLTVEWQVPGVQL